MKEASPFPSPENQSNQPSPRQESVGESTVGRAVEITDVVHPDATDIVPTASLDSLPRRPVEYRGPLRDLTKQAVEVAVRPPPEASQPTPKPDSPISTETESDAPGGRAGDRRQRERMQTFSIPGDPLDREVLPGRFANVMSKLRDFDDWFQRRIEGEARPPTTHGFSVNLLRDQRWAEDHPDEAERILEDVVFLLEDVCAAFRTRRAGEYRRGVGTRRASRRIPHRPRFECSAE